MSFSFFRFMFFSFHLLTVHYCNRTKSRRRPLLMHCSRRCLRAIPKLSRMLTKPSRRPSSCLPWATRARPRSTLRAIPPSTIGKHTPTRAPFTFAKYFFRRMLIGFCVGFSRFLKWKSVLLMFQLCVRKF